MQLHTSLFLPSDQILSLLRDSLPQSPAAALCFPTHLPLCLEKWGNTSTHISPTPTLVFRLAAVMAWAGTSLASNLPLRGTHTSSLCRHPSHVGFPATFLAWGPCVHHGVMVHGYSMYVVWWKERICCLKEKLYQGEQWKELSVSHVQRGGWGLSSNKVPANPISWIGLRNDTGRT